MYIYFLDFFFYFSFSFRNTYSKYLNLFSSNIYMYFISALFKLHKHILNSIS